MKIDKVLYHQGTRFKKGNRRYFKKVLKYCILDGKDIKKGVFLLSPSVLSTEGRTIFSVYHLADVLPNGIVPVPVKNWIGYFRFVEEMDESILFLERP